MQLDDQYQALTPREREEHKVDQSTYDSSVTGRYMTLLNDLILRGQTLNVDFGNHLQGLADALNAIDLEKMSEGAFTSREGGLNVIESPEELQYVLSTSAAFGDQLGYEGAVRLSEAVDLSDLPYDFMDENGNKWVMTEDGTMVRSGSSMDPYVEAAILEGMANDPELSSIRPILGEDADGRPISALLEDLGFGVAGAVSDVMDDKKIPGATALGGSLNVLTVVALIPQIEDSAQNATNQERAKYLLMSDEQIQSVNDHYINRETIKGSAQTVATIPTGLAASRFAPHTLGGSYVIAYVIDEKTGEYIGAVVDEKFDDTWSEEEMYRKIEGVEGEEPTPEEYEQMVADLHNVQPAPDGHK